MDNLGAGQTASSNLGAIAFTDETQRDLSTSTESIFAYVGEASSPAFLAAISSNRFTTAASGTLDGTGLVEGTTALNLQPKAATADTAAYIGPREALSASDILALINNPANWVAQNSSADTSNDGIAPDLPFSTEPFLIDPAIQQISFASDSVTVSHVEGDVGATTVFTFTAQRISGTTGEVNFSGTVTPGTGFDGADVAGGTYPTTFSGTIADGATTGTVSIVVLGDLTKEEDESFQLTLVSASNTQDAVLVAGQTQATGIVVNDDTQDSTPLGAGSIAFVGFNAEGSNNLSFVVLEDIVAGTVINFTDNEWTGSAFNTGENHWSWTATSDIAAGTVVTMDDLATSPISNLGTIGYSTSVPRGLDLQSESIYAYEGSASAPAFLAGLSSGDFQFSVGRLDNTGLVLGETAISLSPGHPYGQDIAAYNGPRAMLNYSDFLAAINNSVNWISQGTGADESNDGVGPDVPFSTEPFVADPTLQFLSFASDSVQISQVEADTGAVTVYTFIVERTNGTTGEANFSGTLTAGTGVDAADFGGTLPLTFSGTIADGATTGTVTITVSGDITLEADESFQLALTAASNTENAVLISGETPATGTIVNNDTQFQTISFAPDSAIVREEGPAGTSTTYTFTVLRDSTVGNLTFTGIFQNNNVDSSLRVDAADFGGTLPTGFTGTILDGQSSGTFSFTVTGDDRLEGSESFGLALTGGLTDGGIAAVPHSNYSATHTDATILNDDFVVHSGEDILGRAILTSDDGHLLVENGGYLHSAGSPILLSGDNLDAVIDNDGVIGGAIGVTGDAVGNVTINNHVDGVVNGSLFAFGNSSAQINSAVLNNDGLVDGHAAQVSAVGAIVNNSSTGVITSSFDGASLRASLVNNYGQITSDAKDAVSATTIHNYAGGWIEGARHASAARNVINEAGGTMIGRIGSAVNVDNDAREENRVFVTNYGVMKGGPLGGDGDAIDVDGLLTLENYGYVGGLGANGYHDGEPNVSEGIAIGGGIINNHEGGEIYGYGRAIEVDNSSNSDAPAAVTITNAGLVQGDGHPPEGVSAAEVAYFAARIQGGEAINIEGSFADSLTNAATGVIGGGVKMGGGDDTVINEGTITATGGSAVNLGEGNDTFEAHTGSTVVGLIDGGEGNDILNLVGTGEGAIGDIANVETINLVGGSWTLGDEGAAVVFKDGTQTLAIESSVLADGNFAGVISGAGIGDAIDLKGVGLATGVALDAGMLTITGGANGPVTLQLDPSQDFSHFNFALADDGAGGTTILLEQKTMGPGSIAFTGFAADTNDALSFVALTDISAGTVINFNQGKWDGDSFSNSASVWSWTATDNVAAGTIINMDMVNPAAPTSNIGDIDVLSSNGLVSFGATNIIYAYTGAANAPETFLSAITGDTFAGLSWDPATLNGTGLTDGLNAISFHGTGQWGYVDIAAYTGPRLGSSNFEDYLSQINDKANWISQTGPGNLGQDGVGPETPFSNAGFSNDPNVQVVNFAADSLTVSQAEGDNGETIFTFTVERTGGTTGSVSFSGKIEINGLTLADDFGGTAPVSFTGTIEAGQTSGTITVRVSGDTQFERNETFKLSLQSLSNNGANAVLGDHTVSNATITNDDAAPATIAFVGINTDGGDNLAFVAASDIAAGTVIHFTDDEWNGSGFTTGESRWSWTATSDISAGTVITMDGLNTAAASSNHGSITFTTGTLANLDESNTNEQVYAYVGTPDQPIAFLTAISNAGLGLAGTGLTLGVNAVALSPSGADIAYYNGPRTGQTSMEGYLSAINNSANWIKQDTSADNTNDGTLPELPFPAHPFSTDPAVQVVQFAAGSLNVTKSEGQTGTETAFTFTIERTGGTEGDVTFTVRVPLGNYATAASAADFAGGMLPAITGTIPAGANSTTITILVKGENLYEVAERFLVNLESASNPNASSVVIGVNSTAAGTINNDDSAPTHILAGETHTATITLANNLTIDQGGSLAVATGDAISWKATNTNVVIDNSGLIKGNITSPNSNSGSLTINNQATGVIQGVVDLGKVLAGTAVTLNNAGHIELGDRIDLRDAKDGTIVVNNLAGGVITQNAVASDIMRPGLNSVVNNHGTIQHAAGLAGGGDGVDLGNDAGKVNNYAGGLIEAARHAVTGDGKVQVVNDGTMIGRNGSAVNMDNDGTEAERAVITNHGRMEGRSANLADSDGDAVDVDGLVTLENYGFIGGMGHNGYHDGEPNVSEGLAVGGGIINNHAGGEIYGYGRAIQIDNSSNSNALGATTIVNAGLIQGDGNLPTDVTPEEQALFAERIKGGEAINIVGAFGDSLTNAATGEIVGGVKMGGGDDVVLNKGTMTATGGSALDMGDGNDTLTSNRTIIGDVLMGAGDDKVTLWRTASVAGLIDLGAGNDTMLGGAGSETVMGGEGADLLDGAGGSDLLTGGADGDQFHFDAASLDGLTVDRIADLSFAEGDTIVLSNFAAGTFAAIEGGNALGVTANGSKATLDSLADIRELDFASDAVMVTRVGATNTLAITVIDGDSDIQQIRLDNAWAAYQELLDNGPAPNELRGSAGNDALDGKSGDQLVTGLAGDDLLIGNAGDDTLSGGDGADRFSFNAAQLTGSDADRITDLDFGAGDTLVFSNFAAGTFAMLANGNPVQMAAGGRGVTLDSFADLAEIDQASDAVAVARDGATDTLMLSVTDADGDVQAVFIDNAWTAYQAALI